MTKQRVALRSRTTDRGPPAEHALVVGQIGPKRARLANGFLLCRDVPVARTGWMMYRPGETPIKTRDNHPVAYVQRGADELFSAQTIGSLITATVTEDHPAFDVTPQNAKHLGKGYCLDARRGEGDDADVLLADVVITDPHAIERIENMDKPGGKPVEISLGYEADYFQTGPGEGKQANILVNHIALVERGRCGPRCAIGDSDPDHPTTSTKEHPMPNATRGAPKQRVKINEARANVQAALDTLEAAEAEEQDDTGAVHVHVHTADADGDDGSKTRTLDAETESRITGLEENLAQMGENIVELSGLVRDLVEGKAAKTGDSIDPPAGGEGDSKALERSFQEFVSQAEVLVPGFRVPTFDSALARAKTVDSMCAGRRAVLSNFYATASGKALVDQVTGGELDIEKADCAQLAIAFRSAAALKGAGNNSSATRDSHTIPSVLLDTTKPGMPRPSMTAIEINAANKKYWAERAQNAA